MSQSSPLLLWNNIYVSSRGGGYLLEGPTSSTACYCTTFMQLLEKKNYGKIHIRFIFPACFLSAYTGLRLFPDCRRVCFSAGLLIGTDCSSRVQQVAVPGLHRPSPRGTVGKMTFWIDTAPDILNTAGRLVDYTPRWSVVWGLGRC